MTEEQGFNAEYSSKDKKLVVLASPVLQVGSLTSIEELNLRVDGGTSDGSHTFDELYYHRMILFSVICKQHASHAWKSKLHDDGTMFPFYFIVGIETPEGQFTYHYHSDYWDMFQVQELGRAPKWDGHTSDDITRLLSLPIQGREEGGDTNVETVIANRQAGL